MRYMIRDIFRMDPLQRALIAAVVYMIPLCKRNKYKLRLSEGVIVCLLYALMTAAYMEWMAQIYDYSLFEKAPYIFIMKVFLRTTVSVLIFLIPLAGVFWYCCKISLQSAAYGAVCAYLTQDFSYTLFLFIMPSYAHQARGEFNLQFLAGKCFFMAMVYSLLYYFFIKEITEDGDYRFNCSQSLPFMLVILMIGKSLRSFARMSYDLQESLFFNIILLHDLLLTGVLLIFQMLLRREEIYKEKARTEKQFRESQSRQYRIFQENVENINHKCHDLKHMVAALKQTENLEQRDCLLHELESSVMIYESRMHTGNKALDVILTNTWLNCEQKQIQWTCMADGHVLDFMDDFDLYIMLENALENAIESVKDIKDQNCRFLSVNIWKKQSLGFIRIENCCERETEFQNDLPVTTKQNQNEHGFGTRSIQSVVDKYQGELSMSVEQGVFILDAMFPLKNE